MTGSNAVLIVTPIVALSTLGLWLGLVYYIGAHPEWKAHRLAREAQARQAAAVAAGGQPAQIPDGGQAARTSGAGQAARGAAGSPGVRHAAGSPGGGQSRIPPRAA
jgi:hypothetical protein